MSTQNRVEAFPQGRVHEQIARHRFAATSNPAVCWCGARTGNEVHSGLPWTPGDGFMSKQCAGRFIGYLCSQRDQMLGLRGKKHTNRPELIEQYGFDTKFAYHAIRLGMQGNEYLNTGRLTLPMPETDRKWLVELREGKRTKQEALDRIDAELDLLRRIELHPTLLPAQADHRWINDYSIDTHQEWWELRELRKWTTP